MPENAHEFQCTGPIQAEISLGAGDIVVATADELVATVLVSPGDGREGSRTAAENTRVEFDHDRLRVHNPDNHGWGFRRGGQIRVELRLPVDSTLRTQAGSADLRASGRLGSLEVKTGSGDVTVAETSGSLHAESGSGDVRAQTVGGELHVRTASGDITAGQVRGGLSVTAASADVTIDDVSGPVRLSTASGDIRLGVVHGPDLRVNSASGDVTVGVPIGTRVWLDLSTVSGSTRSDLEMTGQQPTDQGATTSLAVRTISGDIHIRRVGG
jgi:DUF4097 and DUF4098 domain-containing protein YvlB